MRTAVPCAIRVRPNFIWKCQNGKYLYWYHNHGGKTYDDRNPVWLSGAVEYAAADGMRLKFSQPEILLYDPDVMIRMSYPDMIEEGGTYYFTETQKCLARTHKAETSLIEGLWSQFDKEGERKHGIRSAKRQCPCRSFDRLSSAITRQTTAIPWIPAQASVCF